MKEAKLMKQNCTFENFFAVPSEDNLFKWYFVLFNIGGDYEHGVYLGNILIPNEYPMKPVDIIFITPNGRFQTNKKICLSFTSYHPESWSNWDVEKILLGLISFFNTNERTTGSMISTK